MSTYIICNGELYHAGVKGMKWGRRKARPQAGARSTNTRDVEAQRRARVKKGVAIGTAVVGTALAAYGAYKVHKFVKDANVKIEANRAYESAKEDYRKRAVADIGRFNKYGGGRMRVTSNASSAARSAANTASKDSFGTAFKNVVDFKKNNGSLRALDSVKKLTNTPDEFLEIKKKGLFR